MSGNVCVPMTIRLSLERSFKIREAAVSEACDYATKNEEMMEAFAWVKKPMLFKARQNKKGCDVTSMEIC